MLICDLLGDKITSSFLRVSLHLYTALHVSQDRNPTGKWERKSKKNNIIWKSIENCIVKIIG